MKNKGLTPRALWLWNQIPIMFVLPKLQKNPYFNFLDGTHLKQLFDRLCNSNCHVHYSVIMGAIASQITSLTIVYSTDQRKHQSSAILAFVRRIHGWRVNSMHKGSVKRKMFPFDDVIICATDAKMLILTFVPILHGHLQLPHAILAWVTSFWFVL